PTPSAAAEMAVPVKSELTGEINYQFMRAEKALEGIIRHASTRLESVTTRRVLRQPLEIVNQYEMLLADMERSISDAMRSIIAVSRERMISIPDLPVRLARIMDRKSHRFAAAVQALDQLSPLSIMKRGYAIALDSDRNIIRSAGQASEGDVLDLLMHDGSLACTVNSIKQGVGFGKEEKR
ncbi:MAG TPA: exodeoxyribonuclease VII large subunit, partial [Spirochaetota bacterium]|nr:exodeoxyribonuclease VII large subunit [Spirochaetota bacterium]